LPLEGFFFFIFVWLDVLLVVIFIFCCFVLFLDKVSLFAWLARDCHSLAYACHIAGIASYPAYLLRWGLTNIFL
jgi:hypothetical protein